MRLSATLCRAQEARQLLLAANESLESRRKIALVAANAWAAEAISAEKYEAGQSDALDVLDMEIAEEFALETEEQGDEDDCVS